VEWSVVFYRDGAIFENSGPHDHSKYTHSLPISKTKKTLQLQEFISRQPIALRGSQTNLNRISPSDNSQIGEDEHNIQGNIHIVDSDEGAHLNPSLVLHGLLTAGSLKTRIVMVLRARRKVRDRWYGNYTATLMTIPGYEMNSSDERMLDPEADEDDN
jgi:hypothetical protein